MLPRIAHLIWLGPLVKEVELALHRVSMNNPEWDVRLTCADNELLDEYQFAYQRYCPSLPNKANLIRYSLLEKYGGWYFDIDIHLMTRIEQIEREFAKPGRLCIGEIIPGVLGNDFMGAPLGWQGWQYVKEIVERTERSRLSCVEFSVMLWQRFVGLNQGEQLSVIPAERFQGPVESVAPVASRGRVRGQPTMDLYPSIH